MSAGAVVFILREGKKRGSRKGVYIFLFLCVCWGLLGRGCYKETAKQDTGKGDWGGGERTTVSNTL